MAKAAEKSEKSVKRVVDIADFFTTSKEKEGIWYEAKVQGYDTGLMFKILGNSSDANILSAEQYKKDHEIAEAEKDPVKKAELERKAVCKRLAAIVVDLKAADGVDIRIKGEPLAYSPETVYAILYESMDIRQNVFEASFDNTNFMTKKL